MKKLLLISAFFLIFSCSPKTSIQGTYYHYKGIQKYYTLNVTFKNGIQYLKFEGVSLDLMQKTPWNYTCQGTGRGNTIKCDKVVVNFESNNQIAHVKYSDGKKQTFMSDKKEITEEITRFKE